MKLSKAPLAEKGFSLVEVTTALAIFSFAVMGLVGLLPIAIGAHKEAKLKTVLSQITQRMAAEVQLTDGSQISNLDGVTRMFDVEGVELSNSEANRAVYRARIEVDAVSMPGSTSPSGSLQRVELYAVQDPNGTVINTSALTPAAFLLVSKAENAPSGP